MKPTSFFLFCIVLLLLPSCNHSKPLSIPQNIDQLKMVVVPYQKDNDILPWERGLYIINSIEDIYKTQTEKFIEENPGWLKVDFTKKSIIAVRDFLFEFNHWQYSKVVSFSKYTDDDYTFGGMWKKDDYNLIVENVYTRADTSEEDDESQYRIYQIAFVTEKVPSDASIWLHNNVRVIP